jgi:hypothetical protein
MMERLLPAPLRWVGMRFAPRILMTELLEPDELARVGFSPLAGHRVIKSVLSAILSVSHRAGEHDLFAARVAHLVLQGMVDVDRGGQVQFGVAFTRLGLRAKPFT